MPMSRSQVRIALKIAALVAIALATAATAFSGDSTVAEAPRGGAAVESAVAEARRIEAAIMKNAAEVRPATVCLVFNDPARGRRGSGSGVIVGDDGTHGLVLTCGHVSLKPGRSCTVVLPDGRLFEGESVSAFQNEATDLGLVRFVTNGAKVPRATISTDAPKPGDWVAVLGHSRGLWIDHSSGADPAMNGAGDESEGDEGDGAGEGAKDGAKESTGEGMGDGAGDAGGSASGEPDADAGHSESGPADALRVREIPHWRSDPAAPERESDQASLRRGVRPPIVRAGRVWAQASDESGVRFDAPIDAGDSGGPVVDLSGRVVGIASRCGRKSFWNWASSVDFLDGDAAKLLDESFAVPTADEFRGLGSGDTRAPSDSRDSEALLDSFRPIAERVGASMAILESDGGALASALAVGPGGTLVTKASEVGFDRALTAIHSGTRVPATRIGYDPDADLLLLRAEGLPVTPVDRSTTTEPPVGSLLLNVGGDGNVFSIGAVSLEAARLDEIDGRPFLGISWRGTRREDARIGAIVPGTPAARAGLRRGDRIVSIDGHEVTRERPPTSFIAEHRAGDAIRLEVDRDGAHRSYLVTLDRRQPSVRSRDVGNTRTLVSNVLPHRARVWQQDGVVAPEQCGSAVVDLEGRFVGLNVARSDRTSTLVMPVAELSRCVESMRERPTSAATFARLAGSAYAATETEGRLVLPAVDARLVGARRLGRAIGNTVTEDGDAMTIMSDDRLSWDVLLEAPGRFEVAYVGVTPEERQVRLTIGDQQLAASLEEGVHEEGAALGEVTVRRAGRMPVTFEWADVTEPESGDDEGDHDAAVKGILGSIELRRLETPPPRGAGASSERDGRRNGRGSRRPSLTNGSASP